MKKLPAGWWQCVQLLLETQKNALILISVDGRGRGELSYQAGLRQYLRGRHHDSQHGRAGAVEFVGAVAGLRS